MKYQYDEYQCYHRNRPDKPVELQSMDKVGALRRGRKILASLGIGNRTESLNNYKVVKV